MYVDVSKPISELFKDVEVFHTVAFKAFIGVIEFFELEHLYIFTFICYQCALLWLMVIFYIRY